MGDCSLSHVSKFLNRRDLWDGLWCPRTWHITIFHMVALVHTMGSTTVMDHMARWEWRVFPRLVHPSFPINAAGALVVKGRQMPQAFAIKRGWGFFLVLFFSLLL